MSTRSGFIEHARPGAPWSGSPLAIAAALLAGAAGCNGCDEPGGQPDARELDAAIDAAADAAIDATPDAPACEVTLLDGSMPYAAQGWQLISRPPAEVTQGADHVRIATSMAGGTMSGQALLHLPDALEGLPFKLEVVAQVEQVNMHNSLDAGAAILGSFTPPFGNSIDRSQMIYLDANRLGWADDTGTHAVNILDGAYHTYVLAVDAAGMAQVSIDGAPALTRAGYTTNNRIAIGDQTNDANLDGVMRVKSVRRLCP